MLTIEEIHEIKKHYVDNLYDGVRRQQTIDQTYIDDTFKVPEIKSPHRILRSGFGSRMVDAPAEQIITSNPQALFKVIKGDKRAEVRLSQLAEIWISLLKRQNPNPFKSFVKNLLGRGESFWQLAHNENWVSKRKERTGLPVLFLVPESMVVYASPEEDDCGWIPNCGVPNRVLLVYQRQFIDVIQRYPSWGNPLKKNVTDRREVEYVVCWDKDSRYIEADGEPLLKGEIQPNLYGFTPFVRQYSGFGRRSPDGKLESLIVSDIRNSRDLLHEECAIRSDIASIMHLFAHKKVDLIIPDKAEVDTTAIQNNYDMGAGAFNVLSLPEGSQLKEGVSMLPSQEAFNHLYQIRAELDKRNPYLMAGFPSGSSGRQMDIAGVSAMNRYNTIVENTEISFATAVEMALEICKKIPTLLPDEIKKGDLDNKFECQVKLREPNPVERDRLVTLGDRLWNRGNGSIDLKTNLIEFQGRTQAEADRIIADILVDRLTLYNPDVANVMGMIFAEEAGMKEWLDAAKKRGGTLAPSMGQPPSPTDQLRTSGETGTPMGQEMQDMSLVSRGARQSPIAYSGGQ